MSKFNDPNWTRREMLGRLGAAAGAGLLGLSSTAAMADPPDDVVAIQVG